MDIERYYGPKLRPFNKLSKPVKILCDRHLEWIRKQPCIITGESGGSEGEKIVAHHVQLKSHGTVDYLTVPMKSRLHDNAHAQGLDYFSSAHKIDFKDALIAKLVERVVDLEVDLAKAKKSKKNSAPALVDNTVDKPAARKKTAAKKKTARKKTSKK